MKKALLILAGALSLSGFAQNTIKLTNLSFSTTLAPNDTVYITTLAGEDTSLVFDVTNIGSTQNTYKVKRQDILLNTDAFAYFCFGGQCYTETTFTSPDPAILNPGQSATQLQGSFNALSAYLMEVGSVGRSIVSYTVFNVNDANDFRSFTIKYNYPKPVGIKENATLVSSLDIIPNPANEKASIMISSQKAFESNLALYNSLGQIVYQKEVRITEGKNKIDVNVNNLQSGVYFATIKAGNTSISKKLIVN